MGLFFKSKEEKELKKRLEIERQEKLKEFEQRHKAIVEKSKNPNITPEEMDILTQELNQLQEEMDNFSNTKD